MWLVKSGFDGTEEWNRTFGEADYDYGWCVQETSDGGYILSGQKRPLGIGSTDAWLIKTDSNGNEEWSRTFGGPLSQHAYSAQEISNGGYILTGATGSGANDALLIKTDNEGNELWRKTFGGAQEDWAFCLQETADEGYIIAGRTSSSGEGADDIWLIKTNVDGEEEWNKTFGGAGEDVGKSVQQTADGGYILAGGVSLARGSGSAFIVKTDSNGEEEWNRTLDVVREDQALSVQETGDRGYIIAGCTNATGSDYNDAWLIKTDLSGNEEWRKIFGGKGWDIAFSVRETGEGEYIVAGHTNSFTESYTSCEPDGWLIKFGPENPVGESPKAELENLKTYIINLENVDDSTKNVLTVKLENAIRHLEKGETEKAVRKLEQFTDSVNKLNLQTKINADQADILVQKTQGIIELIEK